MPRDLKKANKQTAIEKKGKENCSQSGEQLAPTAGCVVDVSWELLLCLRTGTQTLDCCWAGGRWWSVLCQHVSFPFDNMFRVLNEIVG